MKYISVPTEIEAVQFTENNRNELWKFVDYNENILDTYLIDTIGLNPEDWADRKIYIQVFDDLHDSVIRVYLGQWLIRGTKGEYYPCDDEVFKEKYRPVED